MTTEQNEQLQNLPEEFRNVIRDLGRATEILMQATASARWAADVAESAPLAQLAEFFYWLKKAYSELDDNRKAVYKVLDALDKSVIPKALEAAGMDKIQVASIARSFYTTERYSASMINKDAAMQWLRDNGHEGIISETVHAQTLASFLRDYMLETGTEPPEDLFKLSSYQTTGMSKYTPK